MTERIDQAFEKAARAQQRVGQAVLDGISATISSSLRPVTPLPSSWVLITGLLFICSAVALAGTARLGFFGFQALGTAPRVIILTSLGLLGWVAARECVGCWIPGSRHYLTPRSLLALSCAALLSVFALLFHDYRTEHFLTAGIICLAVGVAHAIPAAAIVAWFLRKGFLIEAVSGGAIAGTLGGLSGVTMLELHCPNLQAPHVLLWHVAVVPVSAIIGALVGWAASTWRDRRT